MDGRNVKPPDKDRSNGTFHRNYESVLNEIEIKQEPDVKPEIEDVGEMVTVTALERAASVLIVKLTAREPTGDIYDFNNVCELDEAKSEVKKEKNDKEAEERSAERSGNGAIGSSSSNDPKNIPSNKKQKQSKQGPFDSKTKKKSAIKPKAGIHNNKKKSIVSKKCKQHKCSSCDYTTSLKGNLNRHIRKHTGEKPFPCSHCAKRFSVKSYLNSHMRSHVSEFLFSCSNCLKGFSQSGEKVEHEINCKIRRYECYLCKELSILQKSNLEYHMRLRHSGKKPFGCDQCSKKFTSQFELKSHMKTHINLRPLKFKCSVCYRNFSQRIEKNEHETNCKRRGYECYLCKELNSNKLGNLKNHMRIHSGVRPFQCQMCQKSFSIKQNLQQHLKCIHK